MTITFENDSEVIVYGLKKIIAYARRTQQVFVAQCFWWLASIIGLESRLVNHIDTIREREDVFGQAQSTERNPGVPDQDLHPPPIHPDRVLHIAREKSVSAVPRDLTEDQRLDLIIRCAEADIQESFRDRSIGQQGQVNPLPTTKTQFRKARKIKRL
jgi:hypothetical protein